MRIEHLIEQSKSNQQILKESCDGLTHDQRVIVEGIYKDLSPLIEASLTPDQIKNIFSAVEKNATAAGGNRTTLGKGVDVAKQANDTINKVGKWLQDTAPVKGFDQKFENLKKTIGAKFPELSNKLSSMGEWAKANPGKTAAIIGVLTTVASLAGGPVGGAIAGQILKGSAELLKGEKLSTAIGKGAKAAAYGWLTGKAIEVIGNALSSPVETVAKEMGQGVVKGDYSTTIEEIGGKFGNRFEHFATGELYGRREDIADIRQVWQAGVDAWKEGDYLRSNSMFNSAARMTKELSDPEYVKSITSQLDTADKIETAAKGMKSFFDAMADVAQGAVTAKTGEKKQESIYTQDRPLSEGQVYLMFNRIEQLNEGPMWDKLKGAAGSVAGKVAQKAQTVGTNLTTAVTADKLNNAWVKAGSPTDSTELSNFLKAQGVDAGVISQTFKAMKIPMQKHSDTVYAQVKTDLAKLDKKSKRQLAAYLKKQLGTV